MLKHLSRIYKFILLCLAIVILISVTMIVVVRKAGQTITLSTYLIDDISISDSYFLSAETGNIGYSDIFSGINIELVGVKIVNREESQYSAFLPRINFKLDIIKSIINRKIVIGKFYIENLDWRISLQNENMQISNFNYKSILNSLNEDQRQLISLFLGVNEGFLLLNSVINIDFTESENVKVDINLLEINNLGNKLKINGLANLYYNDKSYDLTISNSKNKKNADNLLDVKIGVDKFVPSDFKSIYGQLESINTSFGGEIILSFNSVGLDLSTINIFSLNSKTRLDLLSVSIDPSDRMFDSFRVKTKKVDINIVRHFFPKHLSFLRGNVLLDLSAKFELDDKLQIIESNISTELVGKFSFSHRGFENFIDHDNNYFMNLSKLELKRLVLDINWNNITKQIHSKSIELDIDEGNISGSFSYSLLEEDIDLKINYQDVKIADLTNLLPLKDFPTVYSWLKDNITTGISEGSFEYSQNKTGKVIGGEFFARDATVHYLRPMLPIHSLNTKGLISATGIELTILSGGIGEMSINRNSKVDIDFGLPYGYVHVDGSLDGEIADMISLADSDPINFLSSRNVNFTNIGGRGIFNIQLSTPTSPNPQHSEIALKLDLDLNNLSYDQGPYSIPVSDGQINFLLDKELDYLRISGEAVLGLSSSTIDWQQYGLDSVGAYRNIKLSSLVDYKTGKLITFDTSKSIEGIVDMKINWRTNKNGNDTGQVQFDITDALIAYQNFNFIKVMGSKGIGTVNFSTNNNSNNLLKFTNSSIEFAEDKFEFNGLYDLKKKQILSYDLAGDAWGKISNFNIYYNQEPSRVINLSADKIPKNIFFNLLKSGAIAWQSKSDISSVDDKDNGGELIVNVNVKSILIDEEKKLSDLTFTYNKYANNIDMTIGLKDKKGRDLFDIETVGDNNYQLIISDLGVFSENMNLGGVINGGKLITNFKINAKDSSFFGKYNITKARLTNAPVIIKIFEAFSLAGISETFGKKGTVISSASGDFVMKKSILSLASGSIKTPTTDVTYTGEIDLGKEYTKIEGTFSPLYQLNQLIGNIPIIKQLITDPKSSGSLFSIRYKLEGKFDDIKISSNPIYSIIPGILKRLERSDKDSNDEKKLSNKEKLKKIIEGLSNKSTNQDSSR